MPNDVNQPLSDQEIIDDARSSAYTAYFINAVIGYADKIAKLVELFQDYLRLKRQEMAAAKF
jgi:hypothetical protein